MELTSRFGSQSLQLPGARRVARHNFAFQYRRNRKSLLDTLHARRTRRCLCNCNVGIPICHILHRSFTYIWSSHAQNSAASSSSKSFCTGNIITSSLTSNWQILYASQNGRDGKFTRLIRDVKICNMDDVRAICSLTCYFTANCNDWRISCAWRTIARRFPFHERRLFY